VTASAESRGDGPSVTTPTQGQEWANLGAKLRAAKREANAVRRPGVPAPLNAAVFAYRSRPITVDRNGSYQLLFGPLDGAVDLTQKPIGYGFSFPPDMHFVALAALQPGEIVQVGEEQYFKVQFNVTNFEGNYPNFTVWMS
jgi:hypothetical protein